MSASVVAAGAGAEADDPPPPQPPPPAAASPPEPAPQQTSSSDPAPDPAPQQIEVGPGLDDDDDAESAFGDGGSRHSTESLTSSIYAYRKLHGRTFQANSEYWGPNDDQQNEGLDILHHALVLLLGDRLYLAPIDPNPARILDIGTGTGIWAIDMADEFPGAEVTGTDITPIQPAWVPPNLKFVIDDCLLDWTWPPNHFDFIHARMLYGSVTDWGALYQKAFRHLKPGGWFEDFEINVRLESDHVLLPDSHIFNKWATLFYEGGEAMGRTFAISCEHRMRDHLEAAGFVDIVEQKFKVPCHGWAMDPRLREIGYLTQLCLEQSLDGFALYVLTQILGWTKDETFVLLAQMRNEMKKKSNCAWLWMTLVYGRKPLDITSS